MVNGMVKGMVRETSQGWSGSIFSRRPVVVVVVVVVAMSMDGGGLWDYSLS